jgi:hypothetical protein
MKLKNQTHFIVTDQDTPASQFEEKGVSPVVCNSRGLTHPIFNNKSLTPSDSLPINNNFIPPRGKIFYDSVVSDPPPVPRPSLVKINTLREKIPSLFKGNTHKGVKDRYGLNLLNLDDYLNNWNRLHGTMKEELVKIVEANWDRENSATWGIKKRFRDPHSHPFAEHLLFMAGVELRNMGSTYHRIIPSNLIDDNGYRDPSRTDQSWIDPRAAVSRIRKWRKNNKPELLFPKHRAIVIIFNSGEDLHYVGENTLGMRNRYNRFFNKNEKCLLKWVERGRIEAFYTSHEISLSSVWNSTFRPHTHGIIWIKPDTDLKFLKRAKGRGLLDYLPKIHRSWNGIRNFIPYTMRVSPLVDVYRKEFEMLDMDQVVEFNKRAVHCVGKLADLWKNPSAYVNKRRIAMKGIPTFLD